MASPASDYWGGGGTGFPSNFYRRDHTAVLSIRVYFFLLSINFWIKETIAIVKKFDFTFLWPLILLSKIKKKRENECVHVTVAYRGIKTN